MPKLLKTGEVQLHMPRTGGRSLAKDLGVRELRGTMHDGPEQIPEPWREYPVVATLRMRRSWEKSMINYLIEIEKRDQAFKFNNFKPVDARHGKIDPTFGLWDDPEERFLDFAFSHYGNHRTWYELYVDYFISPADRIVPISKLQHHIS